MKKLIAIFLAALMLSGCGNKTVAEVTTVPTAAPVEEAPVGLSAPETTIPYESRFDSRTLIELSDEGITVDGGEETEAVYTSRDIIYYEDRDAYDSGNPYGEGEDGDKHTAEEAQAHLVANITAPGAYEITGKLSAGQIRVDLGDNAYEDPDAVVELILCNADITCTVAPAILFLNTYECDGNWSVDEAKPEVDTSAAGANLILDGENKVSGSYVARIYKDKEGEKKLWKQDGAIYSYMSLNVFGPGSLDLTAENEGLDTELHLTINGGDIAIRSGNDGINTNEDGVSVTTINAGTLHIIAGLGEEGDGIDSNGYLVINGGTVVSSANPAADAGLDSDLGSYVNGGTVIALGSTMDWAESESGQVTMNLQFADFQSSGSAIVVTKEDGTVVFAYDPSEDEVLGENDRRFMGAVISCPNFQQGQTYNVYLDGTVSGEETGGVYTLVSGYEGGRQMQYSGTDMGFGSMRPGGNMGDMTPPEGFEGEMPEMPEDFQPGQMPEGEMNGDRQMPEGGFDGEMPTMPEGETMPEGGFGGGRGGMGGQRPDGEMPEDFNGEMPEGFDGEMPEDFTLPEGETMPEGGFGGRGEMTGGNLQEQASTGFYMQDMVNAFSGVSAVTE